jgi:glutaminyl-tRNA synthetase
LFQVPAPDQDKEVSFLEHINPNSFNQIQAFVEPSLANAQPETRYQFQRMGYFVVDQDSREGALVFNKTVGLRDTWAKQA